MDMGALTAFGSFVISACTAIGLLYRFYRSQRTLREAEIRKKAVEEYIEKTDLQALKKKVEELEQRGEEG
jgi:hypothetical protein